MLIVQQHEDHYAKTWHLVIKYEGKLCREDKKAATTHTTYHNPTKDNPQFGFVFGGCFEYTDPVDYGFSIGIGSNLRMQAYVTPGVVKIGEPIHLTAMVGEAGLPSIGCNVTVTAQWRCKPSDPL